MTLRQVCCTLLDNKGCVSLQWERIRDPGKSSSHKWEIAYKRWFFSTAIEHIDHWHFSQKEAVAQHLATCPYNVKMKHKDPKKLDFKWPVVMKSLEAKLANKRNSEWFIQ